MVLTYADNNRDLVSLQGFLFFSHLLVFLWVISAICCLKYPNSCFSFLLCFLVFVVLLFLLILLLLAAVIRISLLFLMYSSKLCIDTSMQSSMQASLLPYFLDIYCPVCLVSLFNGISTFVGYLMSKPFS